MRFPFILVFCLLCTGFWACIQDSTPSMEYAINQTEEELKGGPCTDQESPCITVSVEYPQLSGTPQDSLDKVNAAIVQNVAQSFVFENEGDQQYELEKLMQAFVQDYEDLLAEDSTYTSRWFHEVRGEVVYDDGTYLTVQLVNTSYLGGAHPNSYLEYLDFHLPSGSLLENEDLVADTTELKVLAEQLFREERQMAPDSNLNAAGFFWDGAFVLPAQMGLGEEGLHLFYNSYEVAPYALGTTELVVPFDQVKLRIDPSPAPGKE